MMKFGVFNIIVFLVLSKSMFSQNIYSGTTLESNSNNLLADVEIYDYYSGFISKSNQKGEFKFSSEKTSLKLVFQGKDQLRFFDHRFIGIWVLPFAATGIFMEILFVAPFNNSVPFG